MEKKEYNYITATVLVVKGRKMAKMRRWRCLVCGFVVKGEESPGLCPACHAGASQFVPSEYLLFGFAKDIFNTFTPHPVAAHFSNGLIPVSALLLFLWFLTGDISYETASFYTLTIAVLSLPVSVATGLLDWRNRYGNRKLPVFRVKLVLSLIVMALGVTAVALRYSTGAPTTMYMLLVGVMFCIVVVLGHQGAKLVFYWKKEIT
jgi:uncharacterized membrane protein